MIAPCSVKTWLYGLGRHDGLLRRQQLEPDQQREDAADRKKQQDRPQVHDADPLVVERRQPATSSPSA